MKQIFKEISSAIGEIIEMTIRNFRQSVDIILVSAVISFVIFLAADILCGHTVKSDGVVVDRVYIPERNYMTISTTTDGKGHTRTYPVYHHDPAEWKFIVKDNDADVTNVWCSQSTFYRTPIGTKIPIYTRYGRWTCWRFMSSAGNY